MLAYSKDCMYKTWLVAFFLTGFLYRKSSILETPRKTIIVIKRAESSCQIQIPTAGAMVSTYLLRIRCDTTKLPKPNIQ